MRKRLRLAAIAVAMTMACAESEPAESLSTVKRGDLVIGVEVTGTLRAVDAHPMTPPQLSRTWDFKLAELAEDGGAVSEGDLLIRFDATDQERELQEAQNKRDAAQKRLEKTLSAVSMLRGDDKLRTAQAEAALRKAQLTADQPSDLVASLDAQKAKLDLSLAQRSFEHAKKRAATTRKRDAASVRNLRNQLMHAQQRVEQIQSALARMTVKAPRAGTVVFESDWQGNKSKVGDSVWRGQTVLSVVSLDAMYALGDVDEVDSSKIALKNRVAFRVDAHPDHELIGHIKVIADTVQRQSRAKPLKIMRIEIAVEETGPLELRPGMRFRGTVEIDRVPDALLVPAEAVVVTADGPIAYRVVDGASEIARLKLGRRNRESIEVLWGLREGDRVAKIDSAAR